MHGGDEECALACGAEGGGVEPRNEVASCRQRTLQQAWSAVCRRRPLTPAVRARHLSPQALQVKPSLQHRIKDVGLYNKLRGAGQRVEQIGIMRDAAAAISAAVSGSDLHPDATCVGGCDPGVRTASTAVFLKNGVGIAFGRGLAQQQDTVNGRWRRRIQSHEVRERNAVAAAAAAAKCDGNGSGTND